MSENTTTAQPSVGELVEAVGQTWQIDPPNNRVKEAFSLWLKVEARKALLAHEPYLPKLSYASEASHLTAACIAGAYDWGGEVFSMVVGSERGTETLLVMLLKVHHPDATPDLVKAIAADNHEGLKWAYGIALASADPTLFPMPTTPRPQSVRPATDLMPAPVNPVS